MRSAWELDRDSDGAQCIAHGGPERPRWAVCVCAWRREGEGEKGCGVGVKARFKLRGAVRGGPSESPRRPASGGHDKPRIRQPPPGPPPRHLQLIPQAPDPARDAAGFQVGTRADRSGSCGRPRSRPRWTDRDDGWQHGTVASLSRRAAFSRDGVHAAASALPPGAGDTLLWPAP